MAPSFLILNTPSTPFPGKLANVCFTSEERNIVRQVLDVQTKGETLHVTVQKMGQLPPPSWTFIGSAIPGQHPPNVWRALLINGYWSGSSENTSTIGRCSN